MTIPITKHLCHSCLNDEHTAHEEIYKSKLDGPLACECTCPITMACGHPTSELKGGTPDYYCEACRKLNVNHFHEMQVLGSLWEAATNMTPDQFQLLKDKVLSAWED